MPVDPAIMSELYSKLGVSSREAMPTSMPEETVEEVVSTPEDPSMAAQAYGEFEKLPLAQQLALYVSPVTGHALSAYETPMFAGETKEALEEGNIPRALGQGALTGLSALGMIPGLGLGIRGVKAGVRAATKAIPKIDFPNLKNKFLFDELQDNDYVTLYHGTNKANLERVAKEGIKADKEGFAYLTPDPDTGLGYASMGKGEKSIIHTRKRIDPAHASIEDRILLEVKVPRKMLEENLPNQRQWAFNEKKLLSPEARQRFYENVDETGMSIGGSGHLEPYYTTTELRFQGGIPPELITGHTTKFDKIFKNIFQVDETKSIKEALDIDTDDILNWKANNKGSGYREISGEKLEKLQQSVRDVKAGKKSVEAHKKTVQEMKAIRKISLDDWNKFIKKNIPTEKEIAFALRPGKGKLFDKDYNELGGSGILYANRAIEDGTITTSRLDIRAYEDFDKWIATLTPSGGAKVYGQSAYLTDVKFTPSTDAAMKVGIGEKTKAPFGVMEGGWKNHNPQELIKTVKDLLKNDEWVQVGYDPRRHGHFYTRGEFKQAGKTIEAVTPIESASEVIQIGPLVLAKNPVFGNIKDMVYKQGGSIVERNPNTHNMRAI